jgi:hypothetical protein
MPSPKAAFLAQINCSTKQVSFIDQSEQNSNDPIQDGIGMLGWEVFYAAKSGNILTIALVHLKLR